MSASKAIGQHRINKIIHKKKAAMATSIVAAAEQSMRNGTAEPLASSGCYETEREKVSSTANSLRRRRLAMEAGTSASSRMCESSISEWRTRPSA